MGNRIVVVGIDPGSTVGYAVMDFDGRLLVAGSEKKFTLNDVIKKIISFGEPVVVGTDKRNVPYFVSQFAAKTGAKVFFPRKDLLVLDKRKTTENFSVRNYHEMDAVAAAIFALNEVMPLVSKIKSFVRIYGKENIHEKILKKVILEGINIKDAAESIEEEIEEMANVPQETEKKDAVNENIADDGLRYKIRKYEKDIWLLKSYNRRLERSLRRIAKKLAEKESRESVDIERRIKSAEFFREQRIGSLIRMNEEKEKVIVRLKGSADRLNIMLSEMRNNVVVKKIPNLSFKTFEQHNKVINLQEGDVLLVENPNVFSEQTVEMIKDKVGVILWRVNPAGNTKDAMPFVFVNANGVAMIEDKFFCSADKKSLDEAIARSNVLERVVDRYKKERRIFS